MNEIPNIILAILLSFLAAYFGGYFAIRGFYQKKSWERRAQAYEELVAALYDVVQYCAIQKEDYGQGTGLSADQELELWQDYRAACSAIKKATDIGLLYVSAPVYQVLLDLRKQPMLNPEHEPRFDVYEQEYEKHDSAMKEIISIASKDLYLNTPLLTGLLQRIKQGMK